MRSAFSGSVEAARCAGRILAAALGHLVLAAVWIVSALATWLSFRSAIVALVFGGMLIFPLCLPLIGAATLHSLNWFYPAFMIVVGVHYLPFVTLYGIDAYAALAAVLIASGLLISLYVPAPFALGG